MGGGGGGVLCVEKKKRRADNMRLLFLMSVTAVYVLFLLKLRWTKTKSIYDQNTFCIYCSGFLLSFKTSVTYIFFVGRGGRGLLSGVQYIWRGLLSVVYFFVLQVDGPRLAGGRRVGVGVLRSGSFIRFSRRE